MSPAPIDGEVLPPEQSGETGQSVEEDERTVRAGFWKTFKRAVRQIPFSHDLVAAYYCAMDPAVPLRVRATLLAALAYFVAPIDAIPDFLVGVGFADDATVLLTAIAMVATHITERHRDRARDALQT
ncbi:MAG: YkvA family protein [Pseudomonadota bacterium]